MHGGHARRLACTAKRICAALLLGAAASAASAETSELEWLSGHWCGLNDGVFNEEVWLPAQVDGLIGMHRDSRNGVLAGFEFLRIVRENDRWVLLAQPSGAAPIAFAAARLGTEEAEFVNPQHDFPRRIRYRRLDAETLQAQIDDGSEHGPKRQWIWRRDCSAKAPRHG